MPAGIRRSRTRRMWVSRSGCTFFSAGGEHTSRFVRPLKRGRRPCTFRSSRSPNQYTVPGILDTAKWVSRSPRKESGCPGVRRRRVPERSRVMQDSFRGIRPEEGYRGGGGRSRKVGVPEFVGRGPGARGGVQGDEGGAGLGHAGLLPWNLACGKATAAVAGVQGKWVSWSVCRRSGGKWVSRSSWGILPWNRACGKATGAVAGVQAMWVSQSGCSSG